MHQVTKSNKIAKKKIDFAKMKKMTTKTIYVSHPELFHRYQSKINVIYDGQKELV